MKAQLSLINFQFLPQSLNLQINCLVRVSIGSNEAKSQIYSGTDRFFVIGIEQEGEELAESDPLYEKGSFEYQFEKSGRYIIRCVNYTKVTCIVNIFGQQGMIYMIQVKQNEEIYEKQQLVEKKRQSPINNNRGSKQKQLSVLERPFRISQQDVQQFSDSLVGRVMYCDEEEYVDEIRKLQKDQLMVVVQNHDEESSKIQDMKDKCMSKLYEARSEQRVRTVPEEDEDEKDDSLSCFNDFSKDAQTKRQKMKIKADTPILSLSNADSLSTYHTWQPLHQQHSNKIETQSTYSEICDQLPFSYNAEGAQKDIQQRGGRKNSDPLIQNIKGDQNSPIKKYRYANKQQEGSIETKHTFEQISEQDSSDKTGGQKSSDSDKEKDNNMVVPKFFQELVKQISRRRDSYKIDDTVKKILIERHEHYNIAMQYLDEDKATETYNKAKDKIDDIKNKNKTSDKKEPKEEVKNYESFIDETEKKVELQSNKPGEDSNIPNVQQQKQTFLQQIQQDIKSGVSQIEQKANNTKQQIQQSFKKLDEGFSATILKQKNDLNKWIAVKADERILLYFSKMEDKIVESTKDKNMPQFVQNFTEDLVTSVWHDVTDLVRFELRVQIIKPEVNLSQRPDKYCILRPWYAFRNWILYAVFPYNKTFGEKMKSASFIFIKTLQYCPYYGIQSITFFILFLGIDKTEEYQLVNYILNYKNTQFLTFGCLSAIIGYFQYFYCATIQPSIEVQQDYIQQNHLTQKKIYHQTKNPDKVINQNYCFANGPGSGIDISVSLISYMIQISLIWISYFLIYKSQSKVDSIQQSMKMEKQNRGGRLKWFMLYELTIFLITTAISCML